VKKRIHVDQHAVRRNVKAAEPEPVISVKTYRENVKAFEVELLGPGRVVYRPDQPLSCGARVWIETDAPVRVNGRIIA
jgi:hypothetical protein